MLSKPPAISTEEAMQEDASWCPQTFPAFESRMESFCVAPKSKTRARQWDSQRGSVQPDSTLDISAGRA